MIPSLSADDIRSVATWPLVINAIREGHKLSKAQVGDSLVGADGNMMLVRSAWIDGMAAGVKAATVVPENPNRADPLPTVHAQVMLFNHETGQLEALLDGTEITAWKTAGDSALGCDLLARKDASTLLMVGAGAMADPLIRAHLSVRPSLKNLLIWNRTKSRADDLAERMKDDFDGVKVFDHLASAVPEADIICCATMTNKPVLPGALVTPGTHVDLVGAYKPDMREADDALFTGTSWFVDSFDTTLDHIGELKIPLTEGTITRDFVRGDFYDLIAGKCGRENADEITVFKNGGGAHLDVMVSDAIAAAFAHQNR